MTEHKWAHYKETGLTMTLTYNTSTGSTHTQYLNGIPAGTNYNQRDGTRIKLKSIELRGRIQTNSTTTTPWLSRLLLVYDAGPTGSNPPLIDYVLNDINAASSYKLDYKDRLYVLWDSMNVLDSYDTSGARGEMIDINVNLEGLTTLYKGSSAAYTDCAYGAIYLMGCSDLVQPADVRDMGGKFTGIYKIKYED